MKVVLALVLGGLVVPIGILRPAALLGAAPAVAWMRYAERRDAGRPEPPGALRRMAVAGALAVVPVAVVEVIVDQAYPSETTVFGAFFAGFVVAGLVEESAKALCLRIVAWNRPEFDERLDAMVYAAWAGLGFALVENVGYLAAAGTKGGYIGMFVMRALLSVPSHAATAAIMGYFAARRRFDGAGPGIPGGLALAVALHGTFDFAAFRAAALSDDGSGTAGLFVLVVLVVVAIEIVLVRRLSAAALAADDADPRLARPPAAGPVHLAGLPARGGWPPPAVPPPSGGSWPGR